MVTVWIRSRPHCAQYLCCLHQASHGFHLNHDSGSSAREVEEHTRRRMFGVGAFAPSVLKCWYLAVAFPEGWRQQLGREVGPQHPGPRHCSGLLHTFKEIERRTLSHKHHRGTSVQSVGHPPTFPLLGAFMVGPWPLPAGGAHTLQLQDLSLGMRSQGRGVPEHRPPSPLTCLVCWLFSSSLRTMTLMAYGS